MPLPSKFTYLYNGGENKSYIHKYYTTNAWFHSYWKIAIIVTLTDKKKHQGCSLISLKNDQIIWWRLATDPWLQSKIAWTAFMHPSYSAASYYKLIAWFEFYNYNITVLSHEQLLRKNWEFLSSQPIVAKKNRHIARSSKPKWSFQETTEAKYEGRLASCQCLAKQVFLVVCSCECFFL